jgi:hypothetical protein
MVLISSNLARERSKIKMGCITEEQYGVAVTGEMSIAQGQTKEQAQPQALVLQEVQVQQQMKVQGERFSVHHECWSILWI